MNRSRARSPQVEPSSHLHLHPLPFLLRDRCPLFKPPLLPKAPRHSLPKMSASPLARMRASLAPNVPSFPRPCNSTPESPSIPHPATWSATPKVCTYLIRTPLLDTQRQHRPWSSCNTFRRTSPANTRGAKYTGGWKESLWDEHAECPATPAQI